MTHPRHKDVTGGGTWRQDNLPRGVHSPRGIGRRWPFLTSLKTPRVWYSLNIYTACTRARAHRHTCGVVSCLCAQPPTHSCTRSHWPPLHTWPREVRTKTALGRRWGTLLVLQSLPIYVTFLPNGENTRALKIAPTTPGYPVVADGLFQRHF